MASVLYILVSVAFGQDRLKIELSSEKIQYLLGEPVIMNVTLTNMQTRPLLVPINLGPEMDEFKYTIMGPKGDIRIFAPLYVIDGSDMISLSENESLFGNANLFFGGTGYSFSRPGIYKIMVEYQDAKSKMYSITVLEPDNEEQKEQAAIILDHREVGLFVMLEGGDELNDALEQMALLEGKYPDSPLTAYMKYAKGKNYSVPSRNFVTKKPRQADYITAIQVLSSVQRQKLQFYYQIKLSNTLLNCYKQVKQQHDAEKEHINLDKLIESRPDLQRYYRLEIDR